MRGLFNERNNSWSTRYNFAAYLNKSLTILPNKSLIDNIGCDGTGTNCSKQVLRLNLMDREVNIPPTILFDAIKNKKLLNSFKPHGLMMRLRYYLMKHQVLNNIIHRLCLKTRHNK